jgi:D-aspartate ligase
MVISAAENAVFRSRQEFLRRPRPRGMEPTAHFRSVLLGPQPGELGELGEPGLDGAVVQACGDEAIEFIIAHRAALSARYLLDWHKPKLQAAMLDKEQTLKLAVEAGIPCPRFQRVHTIDDVRAASHHVEYPVLLKPLHSHLFQRHFRSKLLVARDSEELQELATAPLEMGLEMMLTELIPGPDSRLSSYYTHLDDTGEPLFHFTKRVIRRNQVNFGSGCYHETQWLPETAALGLRFFQSIGFTGLGNVEFKRDHRDGKLKLIEVNARITAANQILVSAGLDMPWLIYQRLLGRPAPDASRRFRDGLTLWYPMEDLNSFRELRSRGELSLAAWIRSVWRPQIHPFFRVDDPVPAFYHAARELHERANSRLNHVLSSQ